MPGKNTLENMEGGYSPKCALEHLSTFQLHLVDIKWSVTHSLSYMDLGIILVLFQGYPETTPSRVCLQQRKGSPTPLYSQRMNLWIRGSGISFTKTFIPQFIFSQRIHTLLLCVPLTGITWPIKIQEFVIV